MRFCTELIVMMVLNSGTSFNAGYTLSSRDYITYWRKTLLYRVSYSV